MTKSLQEWSSQIKRRIFEELETGLEPSEGTFDREIFLDARSKSKPQMGSTIYQPNSVKFEFIYQDPIGGNMIVSVNVTPPERVVFLPVPEWVVESIWQGDIDGSYHFETDAKAMLSKLLELTEPEANVILFQKKQPTRRE